MGLSDLYSEIDLEKLEIPKVYKDIYYKIYFNISKDKIDNSRNSNTNLYINFEKLSDNRYTCVISNQGKNIEILEKIIDKY